MKQLLIIIGAGHGGFVRNESGVVEYTTAPAKMYDHGDHGVAHEGKFTRRIAMEYAAKLEADRRPFFYINSNLDVDLDNRVNIVNQLYADYKDHYNVLYIPIHLNAGKGTGFEVYTSPKQTKSDLYAQILAEMFEFEFGFPVRKDTADGDWDKESPFYELMKTHCPTILPEFLFFDNLNDWQYIQKMQFAVDMSDLLHNFTVRAETEIQ